MTFTPSTLSKVDSNNTTIGATGTTYAGVLSPTSGYNTINIGINSNVAMNLDVQFTNQGITGPIDTNLTYKDSIFSNTSYNKSFQIQGAYYKLNLSGLTGPLTYNVTSILSTDNNTKSEQNVNYAQETYNNPELDSFGKLRVSNPYTLLDIKFPAPNNNSELITTGYTGTAGYTGSFGYTGSINNIYVSGNGTFTTQSRRYCNYQPGKSLLFMASGVLNAGYTGGSNGNGVKSRIGYFDDNNGTYFEYDHGLGYATIYLKNNGTLSTSVPQSNWNIDRMQGYGSSGLNLDWSKAQLFAIDFEWLGVGRVRYGFYANGKINYCHQLTNINALTGPYMQTANLPIRYQIQGTTGVEGSLTQICSTVISEGGYNPIGRPFSVPLTGITIPASEAPIFSLRADTSSSNYKHQNIIPNELQFLTTGTNDNLVYRIYYYPAPASPGITGWVNVNSTYSVSQYSSATAGFTGSGGILVNSGFATGKSSTSFNNISDTFTGLIDITSNINNVSDVITVTISGSGTTNFSFSWFEID